MKKVGNNHKAIHSSKVSEYASLDKQEVHRHGLFILTRGNAAEAEELLRRARHLDPINPAIINDHGIALARLGRIDEATDTFRRAVEISSCFYQAFCNLGKVLIDRLLFDEGEKSLVTSLSLQPDHPETLNNFAYLRRSQSRICEAIEYATKAVSLKPDYYEGWLHLGVLLGMSGDPEGAMAAYTRLTLLEPGISEAFSNKFMMMNYLEGISQSDLYLASSSWGSRLQLAVSPARAIAADSGRLRLGLVSADFRNHPVGTFLAVFFDHLDRSRFQIVCYNNATVADYVTEIIKGSEVTWRDIAGLPDEQTADVIMKDGIQILIDLSGHTAGNRLPLFSLRPAPVQVSWLGYFNTTGHPAMDWILMDPYSVQPEEECWFTEKVYRLPETRFCYTPPLHAPPVAESPCKHRGHVTFGSFNNIIKYAPSVIQAWIELLRRIPEARLLLKDSSFGDANIVRKFRQRFTDSGFEPDRIEFRGKSPHREMLQEYGDVDILLDPFPFNGGLTSCEALWMGVPLVTLAGETPASRQGLTFLSLLGLPELVAYDRQQYIGIALKLAEDRIRLESLRASLRCRMAASPLCDGSRYVRNLEKAFVEIWKEYRQSSAMNVKDAPYDHNGSVPANEVADSGIDTDAISQEGEWVDPAELIELAEGFLHTGMAQEAIVCLERAASHLTESPDLFLLLGRARMAAGRLKEAEQSLEQAVDLAPGSASVYRELGTVMLMQQKTDDAEAYYRLSLGLADLADTRLQLVTMLRHVNRFEEAEAEVRSLLEIEPRNVAALCELGEILLAGRRYGEAKDILHQAVTVDPLSSIALYRYGKHQASVGELNKAISSFRHALELDPESALAQSALLFVMNYLPEITPAESLLEGELWWRMQGEKRLQQAPPVEVLDLNPERKIKIGYSSPDLGRHPVGYFLAGVLPSHDHDQFEVYCYSDRMAEDDLTVHLRESADHWRFTAQQSDEALFSLIRKDRIDILVDLAGHGGRNRMTLFAMRPAPVQATWAGYVGTTGLKTMDYLISDSRQSPEWADAQANETIIRLPDGYVCWNPPPESPEPTPLPAMGTGLITFGCFNNAMKINKEVVALWSRILRQVPGSRLLLKSREFSSRELCTRIAGYFQDNGIPSSAIITEEGDNQVGILKAYSRVDIALDPFPYSGGITTLEALWMGVPVVTMPGERFCSRHSFTHLSVVGLTSCIASSPEEYVALAVRFAGDLKYLAHVRSELRERMARSPLLDGERFTRNLEHAYKTIWRNYCKLQTNKFFAEAKDSEDKGTISSTLSSVRKDLDSKFEDANLFFCRKDYEEATSIYRDILKEHPEHPRALRALGVIAYLTGDSQKAIELLERAIGLKSDFIDAYLDLGKVYLNESRCFEAERVIRKAIEQDPNNPYSYNSLASVCRRTLRLEESRRLYWKSLSLHYNVMVHSNVLMDCEYDNSLSDMEIFQEHLSWGKGYGTCYNNEQVYLYRKPFPEKVIRIGYVSGDFKSHPVGYVLLQVLPYHDKKAYKIFCYTTNNEIEDDLTATFKESSESWRDISRMKDHEAVELIRKDRIDILVDLSGHTGGQRLGIFMYRPAPIQTSWLGYWNTTGLKSMDYVIYDKLSLLPDYEPYFVEKALFMPESRFCFKPPWIAPEPGPPPCETKGFVTFGCCATTAKISREVVWFWSQILHQVPNAQLMLKSGAFWDNGAISRYQEAFTACGIDASRIIYQGNTKYFELFNEYLKIDIALDTFPFTGAATTFDALWMGVPVITLVGHRPSGRQTYSFLKVIGMDDLAANSTDEYIEKAVSLALDTLRLTKIRAELRPRLAASPLCDGVRFTKELERLYRQVWVDWCKEQDNKTSKDQG